ncbi:MAG: glycine cleavage system protein GcvH [Deltaproteobacteria bacterium]|nr:glycine cleavage system protein GcvH [Deltaproteobacteria bacterium]
MAKYEIPDDLYYTREDEWVRVERGRATIGVTDYAQQQLGDIVFVELPEVGRALDRGEPFGVVESVKAVADLFAPITGEVVEVNSGLAEAPDGVNADCYGDGWMIVVKLSDESELEQLLSAGDYMQHVKDRG